MRQVLISVHINYITITNKCQGILLYLNIIVTIVTFRTIRIHYKPQ